MAFTVPKTPTQKFQYEKGMETLSGKNTAESHTEHLHQGANAVSFMQFGNMASTAKA